MKTIWTILQHMAERIWRNARGWFVRQPSHRYSYSSRGCNGSKAITTSRITRAGQTRQSQHVLGEATKQESVRVRGGGRTLPEDGGEFPRLRSGVLPLRCRPCDRRESRIGSVRCYGCWSCSSTIQCIYRAQIEMTWAGSGWAGAVTIQLLGYIPVWRG